MAWGGQRLAIFDRRTGGGQKIKTRSLSLFHRYHALFIVLASSNTYPLLLLIFTQPFLLHLFQILPCSIKKQGIKRKWEGFTGVPLPKKLKTSTTTTTTATEATVPAAVGPSSLAATGATASSFSVAASRPNVASSEIVEKKIGQNDHMDKENVVDSNSNDGSGSNNDGAMMDEGVVPKMEATAAANGEKKVTSASTAKSNKKGETNSITEQVTTSTSKQMQQTSSSSSQQQQQQQQPNHPDDDIDVDNLKWNELRKVVKSYGLSTAGRKFELQERLKNYLEEERLKRLDDWKKVNGAVVEEVEEGVVEKETGDDDDKEEEEEVKEMESEVIGREDGVDEEKMEEERNKQVVKDNGVVNESKEEMKEKVADDDVVMEDVIEEEKKEMPSANKSIEASTTSSSSSAAAAAGGGKVMSIVKQLSAKNEKIVAGENMSISKTKVEEENDKLPTTATTVPPVPSSMKKDPPKSALKPSKYTSTVTSSTIHSTPVDKEAGKKFIAPLKKDPPVSASSTAANNQSSKKIMTSSKLDPNSVQKPKMISSIIDETVPTASSAFKSAKVESAKLQEKKKNMAAASEARKARLAEMREKVRITLVYNPLSTLLCYPSANTNFSLFTCSYSLQLIGLEECRLSHQDYQFISFHVCSCIINPEENGRQYVHFNQQFQINQ